jgi:outer membrane protein assembly factor BamB
MTANSTRLSALRLRLVTLLFPPAGLLLLWRSSRSLAAKILGSVGIALLSLFYAGLVIFLLIRLDKLQIEWRGGYPPALTWRKTAPDYAELERNRALQTATAPPVPASAPATDYWTGFRGPRGDGHYTEQPILTEWPARGLRPLWRQPIGGGYASFTVAGGMAFTIEQRRDEEVVAAYRLEDGHELWTHGWPARFQEYYSDEGPRATPAFSNGRVYALGAMGELRCLNAANGQPLWSRNILVENKAGQPSYGTAASPLIVDDKVIVLTSAGANRSVVCYAASDGAVLWTALDDMTGYASPALVTLAGERQIIICAETRTVGMRVEDGSVLWEYPWRVSSNQLPIAQPVVLGPNRFLLSAGYFTGAAAVEIVKTDSGFSAQTLWKNKLLKNKFTSSVFWQGHIYGLDEDILTRLDAATGERKWKDGRYGYGQILLAGGHLVILSGDGDLALVNATPRRHEELARFSAIRGKTWNHAAIAHGRILVRNAAEMACYDIGAVPAQ